MDVDYLQFGNADEWRSWLTVHHADENGVWIRIYKKKFQEHGLTLSDAVDKALCFGWIDSTLNTLDEKSYLLRFTPRRKKSIWSIRNIENVQRLIEEERMTKPGLDAVREARMNGEWDAAIERENQIDVIPPELYAVLRRYRGAVAAYRELTASRKKQYIHWLQSARLPETRKRRMKKIIDDLSL